MYPFVSEVPTPFELVAINDIIKNKTKIETTDNKTKADDRKKSITTCPF